MKLFRADLLAGFSDKLIDIPVESLNLEGLHFAGEYIPCELSSEITAGGFKLKGTLYIAFVEKCDRCLDEFKDIHKPSFELLLTSNKELIKVDILDVILFPEHMEEINLHDVFHDLVFLEEPMKKLCSDNCKGLCPQCGINFNHSTCNCEIIHRDNPWSILKDLIT